MARNRRSDSTRSALLGAGARVFTRRGLYGATIREIVNEAGFSAPVLYYHFHDKEDLYGEVLKAAEQRYAALVQAELEHAAGAVARLHAIVRASVRFAEEDRSRLRVCYSAIFNPRATEDWKLGIARLRSWSMQLVEQTLRDGKRTGELAIRDIATAARLFFILVSGFLVEQAQSTGSAVLDEAAGEDLVRVYLEGIGAVRE